MISGRRGAPGNLHTLFPSVAGPAIGIGSYEPFAGTPDNLGPPEQTLLGVVQVLAPAGPYTVWAERAGNSGFAEQSARNRLLYPLNDQQLVAAEKMLGEPAGFVGVLTDKPVDPAAPERAFGPSRYSWYKTEAIYAQGDPNRVPAIQFLHWGVLRPIQDWQTHRGPAQQVATQLGGVLVFPLPVPVNAGDREAPQSTFAAALQSQFPGGPAAPLVVPSPESPGDVQEASQQRAATASLLVLGIFGCGALAAWAGYRLMRGAQGAPA